MILNKKKIYEIIIIFILIIISLELAIRAFLVKKEKYLFKTEEQFLFYKEKMDKLHHLRDVVGNNANFQNPEKFLFTRLIEKSENKKLILFQGDSRTRQLDEFNKLGDKLKNKNYNIINGGTTSFSPSMMSVQFDIIEKDYNFKPEIVVALIDPTDLGDELCRYRKNLVIENNIITKVSPTFSKNQYYFYQNLFLMSEIDFFMGPKIFKIKKIINHYLKFNLGKKNAPCRYREIQKYLMEINEDEIKYFNKILKLYLNNLEKKPFVKQIYLVLYPHIQHLEYDKFDILYKNKLNKLINSEIVGSKVKIIDFYENNIFKSHENDYNQIFIENDNASHLTAKGIDIFYNNIFKEMGF